MCTHATPVSRAVRVRHVYLSLCDDGDASKDLRLVGHLFLWPYDIR